MFLINVPFLSLDQIYESGQVFNWIKLRESKYIIPIRDRAFKVEQKKERLIINCTDALFYDYLYDYFDINTDYSVINYKSKIADEQLKICANRASGIRILQQDLFEVLITFVLTTDTSVQRVRTMIDSIRQCCGIKHIQSMGEVGKVIWYEFPKPDEILSNADKLDKGILGYRKDVLINICNEIIDGWIDLNILRSLKYVDAREYLMQLRGIEREIADCVCLFGLHQLQAFPVNTHIERIIENDYGCDVETFCEWFLYDLHEYEGVVQQYILYNAINPPQEVK